MQLFIKEFRNQKLSWRTTCSCNITKIKTVPNNDIEYRVFLILTKSTFYFCYQTSSFLFLMLQAVHIFQFHFSSYMEITVLLSLTHFPLTLLFFHILSFLKELWLMEKFPICFSFWFFSYPSSSIFYDKQDCL